MEKAVMVNTKLFKRKMNIFWWANRWIHIKFILRELTSVCVAAYAILFLFFIQSILKGPEAYENFSSAMLSPVVLALHIIMFVGLIFHSITWFNLAPKAMVIKLGNKNIPGVVIALSNYAGWLAISLFLIWVVSYI